MTIDVREAQQMLYIILVYMNVCHCFNWKLSCTGIERSRTSTARNTSSGKRRTALAFVFADERFPRAVHGRDPLSQQSGGGQTVENANSEQCDCWSSRDLGHATSANNRATSRHVVTTSLHPSEATKPKMGQGPTGPSVNDCRCLSLKALTRSRPIARPARRPQLRLHHLPSVLDEVRQQRPRIPRIDDLLDAERMGVAERRRDRL